MKPVIIPYCITMHLLDSYVSFIGIHCFFIIKCGVNTLYSGQPCRKHLNRFLSLVFIVQSQNGKLRHLLTTGLNHFNIFIDFHSRVHVNIKLSSPLKDSRNRLKHHLVKEITCI